MNIHQHIQIIGTSLFLEKSSVLIINDLHIGYESELKRKGILVPRFQLKEILRIMDQILNVTKPKIVLIKTNPKINIDIANTNITIVPIDNSNAPFLLTLIIAISFCN